LIKTFILDFLIATLFNWNRVLSTLRRKFLISNKNIFTNIVRLSDKSVVANDVIQIREEETVIFRNLINKNTEGFFVARENFSLSGLFD